MAVLPLRFRILHMINQAGGKPVKANDIYKELFDEYSGEGQFSFDFMEDHLMSIKAVGLIDAVDPYFDEFGEARYQYVITETGKDRTKYLPKIL
ncbi:MAG: DNA-binding protein [Deltaproteobacteria bacterium]|nr:DNA-binding protein [Deltaproteobacteria bacterium]